ncbi:MAG TPA: hypothetical protein VJH68_02130, partial [Candidatus Nanoarchaeia archaeon]|nr:hypothetical protein [Candidatus Nanoarchaeia archaeon]
CKYPGYLERVITLGTPFSGTLAAWLNFPVPSARQMLPGSSYLQELMRMEPPEVPVISIYSRYDEIVIPPGSAKLNGQLEIGQPENSPRARSSVEGLVHNVCLENVGHGGLITRECYPLIEEWLNKDIWLL